MDDPVEIFNWRRIDARTTTSGQPSEGQLALLRELGVRRVINLGLHTHEKALADEAASVAELGMGYTHIPVDFQNPTAADFGRFCAANESEDGPVHVHCVMNYRVSAFFYRYRRDKGMDEAAARREMETLWQPTGVWAEFCGWTEG